MLSKFRFVYNQIEKTEILEKKVLNDNIYYKHLIRNIVKSSTYKNNILIDDNSTLNKIYNIPKIFFKLSKNHKQISGYSLVINRYQYKNRFNKEYSFNSFFFSNNLNKKKQFNALRQHSLGLENQKENAILSLLLLNPKKGGYTVYCLGSLGFLPRSHYKKLRNSLYKSLKKKKKLHFFSKFNKKFMLFWFRTKKSNISKIKVKYLIKKKSKLTKNKKVQIYKWGAVFLLKDKKKVKKYFN